VIFNLLPDEIRKHYVSHRVAAISVMGDTIRVRRMWSSVWDVWRLVNGKWLKQEQRSS
jgi:hypothetical protein